MKIGFLGAGGTGKTTLAQKLAHELQLPYCASTSRGVYAKYGMTQKDMPTMSPELRKQIQMDNFNTKIKFDSENTIGVFDRTLLDHAAYLLMYCHNTLTDEEYKICMKDVFVNLTSYSILFYFPIYDWSVVPEDGFREVGLANRYLQDFTIKGLIDQLPPVHDSDCIQSSIISMSNSSVEERLSRCLKFISISSGLNSSVEERLSRRLKIINTKQRYPTLVKIL